MAITLCVPDARSPWDALYSSLEGPRETLQRDVAEPLETIKSKPRHADSDDARFIAMVVEYWSEKQRNTTQYSDYANRFYNHIGSEHVGRRGWSLVLCADALDRGGRKSEAVALYSRAATDKALSPFLQRWALQELGNFSYVTANDVAAAVTFWRQAQAVGSSGAGLLENLAIASADIGNWEAAEDYFRQAEAQLAMIKSKKQVLSLVQKESVLYVNWANTLRRRARVDPAVRDAADAKALLGRAEQLLVRALIDPGYLDQYWVGARVAVDREDLDKARKCLTDASKVLDDPKTYDLNRFGYDRHGQAYNAWLEAIVENRATRDVLPQSTRSRLEARIEGFSDRPVGSIYALFMRVKESDVAVDEDILDLIRMADQGFLSK
jgi:tetratricopeptide (TPR) repeat protein